MVSLEVMIKPENEEMFKFCINELIANKYSPNINCVPNPPHPKSCGGVIFNKEYFDSRTKIRMNYMTYVFSPYFYAKNMNFKNDTIIVVVGNQEIKSINKNIIQIKDPKLFYKNYSAFLESFIQSNTKLVENDIKYSSIELEHIFHIQKEFDKNNIQHVKIEYTKNADNVSYSAVFHIKTFIFNPSEDEIISGLEFFNGIN